MAPLMVVAHLQTASLDARKRVIEALTRAMSFARDQEPDVTTYALTIPRQQDDDGKSLYVFEQYENQVALDAHVASQPVKNVIALFGSSPDLLAGPGQIWKLDVAASFARPEANTHESPHIVFGNLKYKPQTSSSAVKDFTRVCQFAEAEEPGTLSYTVLPDQASEADLKTLEVYTNEQYLWDPHANSRIVQDNKAAQADTRIETNLVFLTKVAGYFDRL